MTIESQAGRGARDEDEDEVSEAKENEADENEADENEAENEIENEDGKGGETDIDKLKSELSCIPGLAINKTEGQSHIEAVNLKDTTLNKKVMEMLQHHRRFPNKAVLQYIPPSVFFRT